MHIAMSRVRMNVGSVDIARKPKAEDKHKKAASRPWPDAVLNGYDGKREWLHEAEPCLERVIKCRGYKRMQQCEMCTATSPSVPDPS